MAAVADLLAEAGRWSEVLTAIDFAAFTASTPEAFVSGPEAEPLTVDPDFRTTFCGADLIFSLLVDGGRVGAAIEAPGRFLDATDLVFDVMGGNAMVLSNKTMGAA